MNRSPLTAGLALALAVPSAAAAAADSAETLDAVVVTATRSPAPVARGLAATTVLDRAAIEQAQAPDLIDLLARQAGIDVSRTGGPGSLSTLFLRGGNSNHVLVLVDGVRVNSVQQGQYDFGSLPIDRIERIEIVRGPRAALWGSDAIGGVIQIFTRDPGQRGAQVRVGSFDRSEVAAQWGVSGERGSVGLGGGLQDVGGYNASTPSSFSFDPDRDGFRNRHVSLGGRTTLGTQALGVNLLSTVADIEFDRGLTQAHSASGGATLGGPLAARWSHSLALGEAREDLKTLSSFGSRFESRRRSVDWLHDLALTDRHALLFGLNHVDEDAVSRNATNAVVYDRSRGNTGLFTAWRGTVGAQQWDLAARTDDSSQFGRTNTAQAAWGLALGDGWRLRASWGQGFRAPNTNELYSPGFGGLFAGNPALGPERSRSAELGLGWQGTTATLALSLYRSRVTDLIAFTGPTFGATNINQARLDGAELDGRWQLGRIDLRGNLGWQRAENAATGAALLRRAPRKAALSVDIPANAWLRFGLDATAASRRQDFDGALAGYTRFDLRAEAALGEDWALRARVENLFDRRYTLASGFATPDRSLLVEITWRPDR
ncbi:TonB-dependent vitamin B12 receptor [Silanimonas algicola]